MTVVTLWINQGIQAALNEVFRTPEIILMFAKKQPEQLRLKLAQIQRDLKLGKLSSQSAHTQQACFSKFIYFNSHFFTMLELKI